VKIASKNPATRLHNAETRRPSVPEEKASMMVKAPPIAMVPHASTALFVVDRIMKIAETKPVIRYGGHNAALI
jgi:hypothetical protein